MSKNPKRELSLRGQPRRILAKLRPAFKSHVRPHTKDQKGERLGGGSILNAQWNHRLSRDIDVHLKLISKEDGRAILDRAAKACNGYRVEHPNFPRIEFERDNDNHIDINLQAPTPEKGERIAVVDGEETTVLSNAQIMTGKLKGRGMTSPGRDLFDIAVCRIADPEALAIAVNAVDDMTLDGILTVYQVTEEQYKTEASELEGIPEGLTSIQENPVGYASNAILESRYERVAVRTVDGRAEVHTRTAAQGNRTRTYESADEIVEGMERDGINAFLEAQYRDATAVMNDTVDNIWTKQNATILIVEPRKPQHELLNLARVEWSPPGGGDDDRDGNKNRTKTGLRATSRQKNPVRGEGRPVGGAPAEAAPKNKNRTR